jgi:hypothetical protein
LAGLLAGLVAARLVTHLVARLAAHLEIDEARDCVQKTGIQYEIREANFRWVFASQREKIDSRNETYYMNM